MEGLSIRYFIACACSGSTLPRRIFAKSPISAVTSRLISTRNADSKAVFRPDYSILANPSRHPFLLTPSTLAKNFSSL
ncbi:hypothetical protein QBC34DRAFT_392363 [Podospora aff. communis PSN243]|uniref:Uncharacterized protein n=1 Tax=Podospora aff. communis PSN243 TaxID=3040156 RepID=A0AAV9H2S9_9PEZI|nr:hypothetical protein QBC34DRAFT_392363 [Podospora aff. communis PSN243]